MEPSAPPTVRPIETVRHHIEQLCSVQPDRRPGSAGNRQATDYVAATLSGHGRAVSTQEFDCFDWRCDGGTLTVDDATVDVVPSPYGHAVSALGTLRVATTIADLTDQELEGSVLVVTGDLAKEPLTPKAYAFYANEEHTAIVAALEAARPAAIVAVTDRCPAQCGAVRPFPLVEDGDFTIPTANIVPEIAETVLTNVGRTAEIEIRSERHPSTASNVKTVAGKQEGRILVMAHVDSKPGTPGAVDNASGVAVLLLLSQLLADRRATRVGIELLVVNGEDHYAAPGELAWLAESGNDLDKIALAINIDGAGYRRGTTSYSTYNISDKTSALIDRTFASVSVSAGPAWYQSDHAIFAMQGKPALALTSEPIARAMADIFHSPDDTPDQVDHASLVETAFALADLISSWPEG